MPDLSFPLVAITIIASLLVPIALVILVVALIVWAIRRSGPPPEDPAVAELKARYARGEIDTSEYQLRLRELTGG